MRYSLARPPQQFRRSTVHLDNIALMPASSLPLKAEWQAIANSFSHGEMLIVLPSQEKQQRVTLAVATHLGWKGQQVRVIDQELRQGGI